MDIVEQLGMPNRVCILSCWNVTVWNALHNYNSDECTSGTVLRLGQDKTGGGRGNVKGNRSSVDSAVFRQQNCHMQELQLWHTLVDVGTYKLSWATTGMAYRVLKHVKDIVCTPEQQCSSNTN